MPRTPKPIVLPPNFFQTVEALLKTAPPAKSATDRDTLRKGIAVVENAKRRARRAAAKKR